MNEDRRKAKKFVIGLLLLCVCIAVACFGIFVYILVTVRGAEVVNERMVTIAKIVVMTGIFFLVLALGYLLPILISHKKHDVNGGEVDASEIFAETNMLRALKKYVPSGETLLAGIHAISKETNVTGVFGKCTYTERGLISDENGGTIALNKKKLSAYDIYLGITQSSMIITECKRNSYFYQFDDVTDANKTEIQEVTSNIPFTDIGTCFSLNDIKNCEIKNGWMGSVKCFITMKNGSYFKLMLPKLGGLNGGMPHHAEYRDAIIARLGGSRV